MSPATIRHVLAKDMNDISRCYDAFYLAQTEISARALVRARPRASAHRFPFRMEYIWVLTYHSDDILIWCCRICGFAVMASCHAVTFCFCLFVCLFWCGAAQTAAMCSACYRVVEHMSLIRCSVLKRRRYTLELPRTSLLGQRLHTTEYRPNGQEETQ